MEKQLNVAVKLGEASLHKKVHEGEADGELPISGCSGSIGAAGGEGAGLSALCLEQ